VVSSYRRPSQLALRQAKINVVKNYLLLGVTEEYEDFLFGLETLLPEFFKGILEIYKAPGWMSILLLFIFFSVYYIFICVVYTKTNFFRFITIPE